MSFLGDALHFTKRLERYRSRKSALMYLRKWTTPAMGGRQQRQYPGRNTPGIFYGRVTTTFVFLRVR
jgi:hypothetical protein